MLIGCWWLPCNLMLQSDVVILCLIHVFRAADRVAIGVAVLLPELPYEMWLHVCSFLLRRDWGVPAVEP